MASVAYPARPSVDWLLRQYLAAQLAGDRREALRLVLDEGLARGYEPHDMRHGVVQAAQREIGRLWQQNRISIAQEHMATAISHVVMTRLFDESTPEPRSGRKVVVACVEGEQHEFPARLVADFLDLAGFEIRYLGANVPTDDLLRLLAQEKPDLLALSVTMSFNAVASRKVVERVRAEFPALPILMGGHALDWEPRLASDFGVQTCAPDADSVVEAARRMAAAP